LAPPKVGTRSWDSTVQLNRPGAHRQGQRPGQEWHRGLLVASSMSCRPAATPVPASRTSPTCPTAPRNYPCASFVRIRDGSRPKHDSRGRLNSPTRWWPRSSNAIMRSSG